MPVDQAGVASAVFNASREVAGLLGITVIGAILTSRQSAALQAGHDPVDAFLTGYRAGLIVAALLAAIGGVAAWWALRDAVRSGAVEEAATREDLVLAG
jgi:Na+-transporting NADH:ubiquinone oxidoreductase subunit NqrD